MSFVLHPQLDADTIPVGDLPLCRVLLMNNRHFPWLILVPMRAAMRELHDLHPEDFKQAMQEARAISSRVQEYTGARKMNVAALGNIVPQLHIHVIARFESDKAWPNPVWNSGVNTEPYSHDETVQMLPELRKFLGLSNITKM